MFTVFIYRYDQVHGIVTQKTCIIAPCPLADGTVAMGFWMTRCSKPVFHLVYYDPMTDECNMKSSGWMTKIVCDPSIAFDFEKACR